ncbi:hypothetical protein ACQPZF_00350 [Actinosynnema sp. CS-041913]|uniref:hypothetical protein n=1 Tax=Actinosynnema sp. CS-041913 TaxID=3239917 RepID=UPI003D8DFF62
MERLPSPGDRVRVPFGFHKLEGEVLRTSDFGIGPLVTVAVEVDGADEPVRATYELDAVEVASAA